MINFIIIKIIFILLDLLWYIIILSYNLYIEFYGIELNNRKKRDKRIRWWYWTYIWGIKAKIVKRIRYKNLIL